MSIADEDEKLPRPRAETLGGGGGGGGPIMASRGSVSEPEDVARFSPFTLSLAERFRGAWCAFTLDTEL